MRARIAWGIVGLTTVAFILDTWFTAAHHSLLGEETWANHGWPLSSLAGTVGANKRLGPGNPFCRITQSSSCSSLPAQKKIRD